jgi:hypothetical protein
MVFVQWRIQEFLSGGEFCSQIILRGGQRWAIVTITKKSVGNKFWISGQLPIWPPPGYATAFVASCKFLLLQFLCLLCLAQAARALVHDESELNVRYTKDVQNLVGLIMVICGIMVHGPNYKLLNLSVMKILNISTGVTDCLVSLSFVQYYINVTILYVLEVILCVLSVIFLYISWAWYCDKREIKMNKT